MANDILQKLFKGNRKTPNTYVTSLNPQNNQLAYNPAVFQGASYDVDDLDFGSFNNAIDDVNRTRKETAQAQAAFNESAAKLKTLVNDKEHAWVEDYLNRLSEDYQNSIATGNHNRALRQATIAGSKVLSTPEAMGRIKYQEDYKKVIDDQQKRRDAGEIFNDTYEWWLSKNQYNYKDNFDANGNIISGDSYKPDFIPVKDTRWEEQFAKAFALLNPDETTTGHSSSKSSSVDGTGSSSSSESKHTKKQISVNDITNNMKYLFNTNSDINDSAYQQYEVAKFSLNKLKNQIKELEQQAIQYPGNTDIQKKLNDLRSKYEQENSTFETNGGKMSYKEWYTRLIENEAVAKGLAYVSKQDITGSSTESKVTTHKSEGGGGGSTTTTSTKSEDKPAGSGGSKTGGAAPGKPVTGNKSTTTTPPRKGVSMKP